MNWAPFARNLVRYFAGLIFGVAGQDALANDLDLENIIVMIVAAALGALTEWVYGQAKKRGWAT